MRMAMIVIAMISEKAVLPTINHRVNIKASHGASNIHRVRISQVRDHLMMVAIMASQMSSLSNSSQGRESHAITAIAILSRWMSVIRRMSIPMLRARAIRSLPLRSTL